MIKVNGCISCRSDGLEPVIKHNMILRSDFASVQIQDHGYRVAVVLDVSHIDSARGAWSPSGQFVTVGKSTVEDVYGTTPYVKIVKLAGGIRLACPQLDWGPASVFSRDTVQDVYTVEDGKWPQAHISNIRPMNGSVMQHCARDGCNCVNVALSNTT